MTALKVRPRWKRVLWVPHLLGIYRRAGCGWRESVKIAWMAVTFSGRWENESQRTGDEPV